MPAIPSSPDHDALLELRDLLAHRVAVIADHDLRSTQPGEHLRQLQVVSEKISHWHQQHRSHLSPRLNHFLSGASYQKALAWIDAVTADHSEISSSDSAEG